MDPDERIAIDPRHLEHVGQPPMKVEHEGSWGIRLEADAIRVRFDAPDRGEEPCLFVLTGGDAERVAGFLGRLERGPGRPSLIASEPVVRWAQRRGGQSALVAPVDVRGLKFEARDYAPIPWATPVEAVRKTLSGLRRPIRAARRFRLHLGLPHVTPTAWALTLPDGRRFVHLGGALHRGTPPDWLAEAAAAWHAPDVLLVAPDHEEAGPVAERVPAFAPRKVLVSNLSRDVRVALDLPVEDEEPLVEALRARGIDAEVLPRVRSATG